MQSYAELETGITKHMKDLIDFFGSKYPKLSKTMKNIDIYLLSVLSTFNDPDVISAACNLLQLVIPLQNDTKEVKILKKVFDYLKISITASENAQKFPLSNFETNSLSLMSFAICNSKLFTEMSYSNEIKEYCIGNLLNVIE